MESSRFRTGTLAGLRPRSISVYSFKQLVGSIVYHPARWSMAGCRPLSVPSLIIRGEWSEVCAHPSYQTPEHLGLILCQAFERLPFNLECVGGQVFNELERFLCRRNQHTPRVHHRRGFRYEAFGAQFTDQPMKRRRFNECLTDEHMKSSRAAAVQHGEDAPHRQRDPMRLESRCKSFNQGVGNPPQQVRQIALMVEGLSLHHSLPYKTTRRRIPPIDMRTTRKQDLNIYSIWNNY